MPSVTLIAPRWEGGLCGVSFFKVPPMGLYQLASITPLEWEVRIVDENVQELDAVPTDLVGISVLTAGAPRVYAIADAYRKRGIPVILGGVHVSMCPGEASQHADSIVIGEADEIWPGVLADFLRGSLKPRYVVGDRPDLGNLSSRRVRQSLPRKSFLGQTLFYIQATRGCPFGCEFCSVTQFNGRQVRCRPVGEVIADIRKALPKGGIVAFVDDNIIGGPREYTLRLLSALEELRKGGLPLWWMSQTDVRVGSDAELRSAAVRSGLIAVFLGLEAVEPEHLVGGACRSKASWASEYVSAIAALQKDGVLVEGSFVFGLDGQDLGIFARTVKWAQEAKVDVAQFSVLTPFPGTALWERLVHEGRIHTDAAGNYAWEEFDATHVVVDPLGMSGRDLELGLRYAYRSFYSSSYMVGSLACGLWERKRLFNLGAAFWVGTQFRHIMG